VRRRTTVEKDGDGDVLLTDTLYLIEWKSVWSMAIIWTV
jgi:hypothetical protein